MKRLRYIIMATVTVLLASCMGSDYAAPDLNPDNAPWGNNEITETHVISIAELKSKYASVITSSSYQVIDEDLQIKGVVTGNDQAGNIYQQISLQDETGAVIVAVSASALYGYLPEGQQILVDLKGLCIGGYGKQCQVGGVYTNPNTGSTGIGRMDRYTWQEHFRLMGTADQANADALLEEFDASRINDEDYRQANAGKLMVIRGVTLADANGSNVFAPDDGSVTLTSNCANRALRQYSSSSIVVRTSTYADFANEVMPEGLRDIKGIFTRYNNVWQILLRGTDDITVAKTAALDEPFDDDLGDFTIKDVLIPEVFVENDKTIWYWRSEAYGVNASAYYNSANHESESWLISPAIDLSDTSLYPAPTLTFSQAGNFFGNIQGECSVLASTDGENWSELELDQWPEGNSWTFLTSVADLAGYRGQKTVYIAFRYTSKTTGAGTWEIKDLVVE